MFDVLEWSDRFGWRTILRRVSYERARPYADQYPKYSICPSLPRSDR